MHARYKPEIVGHICVPPLTTRACHGCRIGCRAELSASGFRKSRSRAGLRALLRVRRCSHYNQGGATMAKQIRIEHVYKVFGDSPKAALELIAQGASKQQVLEQTG